MAFEPPVECPICSDVLEPDRTLQYHLLRNHTPRELARFVAATRERDRAAARAN